MEEISHRFFFIPDLRQLFPIIEHYSAGPSLQESTNQNLLNVAKTLVLSASFRFYVIPECS